MLDVLLPRILTGKNFSQAYRGAGHGGSVRVAPAAVFQTVLLAKEGTVDNWKYKKLLELIELGEPVAMVTVVDKGSAPARPV